MNHPRLNPINIIFFSKWDSFENWQTKLLQFNIILHEWPGSFDKNSIYPDIEGALVWDPPNDMWPYFPNLKIIHIFYSRFKIFYYMFFGCNHIFIKIVICYNHLIRNYNL